MNKKQKKTAKRIALALVLFAIICLLPLQTWFGETLGLYLEFALFLVPYLIAGYDVLLKAARNIGHGQVFDENFLMSVATIGAFALVLFPDSDPHMAEGAAVMLFYQVGELFQSYAVGKSRKSIAAMMDIAPEYANALIDGELKQVDPYEVAVGSEIVVKPGERVPLDGVVVSGSSQLDTAALTGESVPRSVGTGDEIISGCVNLSGVLQVRVSKPYGESTVARILELVENAAEKKARTENFITRFARYYTPAVVGVAVLLAVVPPLFFGQSWSSWVQRGLIFLVVSCPCALVISVPLSFFGGIGGASKLGILVKGSNYLEVLGDVDTVVFDKTGTLTSGEFRVVEVCAVNAGEYGEAAVSLCAGEYGKAAVSQRAGEYAEADAPLSVGEYGEAQLLELAAHAEAFSDHPLAKSVKQAFSGMQGELDMARVTNASEVSGHGVSALVDGARVLVGSARLMEREGVTFPANNAVGTVLHVAKDGVYMGYLCVDDAPKPDAAAAIAALHAAGVRRTVMLTGDREEVAARVAKSLGIHEFRSQLLPQDKVSAVEALLAEATGRSKVAFVGDGINDAPVLSRVDVGIAMGAMGSDAAIEAADIVLMDDKPSNIACAIRLARRTMAIVYQNIVFALAIKFMVLALAAAGMATMWLAVFADVGVAVLAILNAMRAMHVKR